MIIINLTLDNTFNQKDYDNMTDNIVFDKLECDCGHVGMIKHGYYDRKIIGDEGLITIVVLRVKCPKCNKTHAILPMFIVPYSRILLDDQISAVDKGYCITKDRVNLSTYDVFRIRRNYNRYFSKIIIIDDYYELHKRCINLLKRLFMQIHKCTILITT